MATQDRIPAEFPMPHRFSTSFQMEVGGPTQLVIRRTLPAPVQRVFEALTQCQHIQQWMQGPDGWSMPQCALDLRVGGNYRYEMVHESGQSMAWGGEFLALDAPRLLTFTEVFDQAWYPGTGTHTTTLTAIPEGTRLEMHLTYESTEARDICYDSTMEKGLRLTYDRLEALLSA